MPENPTQEEFFGRIEEEQPGSFPLLLLSLDDELNVLWIQGKKLRDRLVEDGWSEEMAEHLAGDYVHALFHIFTNQVSEQIRAFMEAEELDEEDSE